MNQMFQITAESFNALSDDEVRATVAVLKECELYALPFPTIDVRISGDCVTFTKYVAGLEDSLRLGLVYRTTFNGQDMIATNYGDGYWMEYQNISLDHINYRKFQVADKTNKNFPPTRNAVTVETKIAERDAVANTLIVLLATRNAIKTTVHKKGVRLGIGRKPGVYEYTTTISVPRQMDVDEDHVPVPGGAKAPHLRRGHVRRQHFGPKNAFVKSMLIAPVFVNADKDFVNKRRAYNVSI